MSRWLRWATRSPHGCCSQRTARLPTGFPALSLCFRTFFPWSPCLMLVYLYLFLGRVPAALTSIASTAQINVRRALCFPHVHNRCLWDDKTPLCICLLRSPSLSFSFTSTYPRLVRTFREKSSSLFLQQLVRISLQNNSLSTRYSGSSTMLFNPTRWPG